MNYGFSELIPAGGTVKRKFTKEDRSPSAVACNIHPWESGWLLIRDNPYMAVSSNHGKLQIKNLPVGTHTFVLWHELAGFIKEAKRKGVAQEFKSGRVTVEIKPGDNDLGEFVIKPKHRQ